MAASAAAAPLSSRNAALNLIDPAALAHARPIISSGAALGADSDDATRRIDPNTASSPYAGVASLFVDGRHLATGVAISRRHILTAAHCFDRDADGKNESGTNVVVFFNVAGDFSTVISPSMVRSVDLHPDFTGFANPAVNDDLAIITLAQDLPSEIPIYPIAERRPELGQLVQLVGYGETGDGAAGYNPGSGAFNRKRFGYNEADLFFADDEGVAGRIEMWQFDFDGPDGEGFSGGPGVGEGAESTLGGGDSGGPGFVYEGDRLVLFSINNFVSGPGEAGAFGSGGGGVIVSAYAPWISKIVGAGSLADLNRDGVVDASDLRAVLLAWGAANSPSDLNRDGTVNLADLQIVLQDWTASR